MRIDAAHELIAFFEARGGRLNGFRFRDPLDFRSCVPGGDVSAADQQIGAGDGETAVFQLIKRYDSGGESYTRTIRKPVAGSVVVACDGEAVEDLTVDLATGIVTLAEAPADGVIVTAGFEFDTPVRFDVDRLDMALVGHGAVRVVRAPLVEIAG